MFFNHCVTSLVSFDRFNLIKFCGSVFILFDINLLVLPSIFWLVFLNQFLGCLKSLFCGLLKQLFLTFPDILLATFCFSIIFVLSLLILLLIFFGNLFVRSFCYLSPIFLNENISLFIGELDLTGTKLHHYLFEYL